MPAPSTPFCRHNTDLSEWIGNGRFSISYHSPYRLERQTILDAVRRFSPHAHGQLLDIGCGHKPYAHILAPYIEQYVGLDMTDSPGGHDADIIGSTLALPFDDQSFDTIVSTQVIEHVTDPQQMLREIARVLRPGGIVLITAPFAWPLHEKPHDFQRFTRYGLEHLATTAGLTVEHITERGGFWMMMTQLCLEYFQAYAPNRWLFNKVQPSILRARPVLFFLSEVMDRRYPSQDFTLGYALVARQQHVVPDERR